MKIGAEELRGREKNNTQRRENTAMMQERVLEFSDLKTSTSLLEAKDANTTTQSSWEFNRFNNCKCI